MHLSGLRPHLPEGVCSQQAGPIHRAHRIQANPSKFAGFFGPQKSSTSRNIQKSLSFFSSPRILTIRSSCEDATEALRQCVVSSMVCGVVQVCVGLSKNRTKTLKAIACLICSKLCQLCLWFVFWRLWFADFFLIYQTWLSPYLFVPIRVCSLQVCVPYIAD